MRVQDGNPRIETRQPTGRKEQGMGASGNGLIKGNDVEEIVDTLDSYYST